MATASASKQRLRLWLRLLRTTRAIEVELRARLRREFAVTLSRFDVMAALYRQPEGMMMSEVSRRLMISNGNVTGIVDRLTADGLAQRTRLGADRRAQIVSLTERGRSRFAAMAAAHERWVDELLGGLPAGQGAALNAALRRIDLRPELSP